MKSATLHLPNCAVFSGSTVCDCGDGHEIAPPRLDLTVLDGWRAGLLQAAEIAERHVPSSPSAAGEYAMRRNGQDIAMKIRDAAAALAQGIETRRAETEGLGAKPESPVGKADAP